MPDGTWGVCEKLPQLYAWQQEAFDKWSVAHRRGIVEAVTGTGKTMVALMAIGEALCDGRKVTVLVHTQELQRQWRTTLRLHLPGRIRIGQLGGSHHDSFQNCEVLVAIVNSARVALREPPPGSLLVADECHHYASTENRLALDGGYDQRLGLTATLERSDQMERVLLERIGPLCHVMGYSEAIADEVTAHFTVALIGVKMSPTEHAEYRTLTVELGRLTRSLVDSFGLPREPFHRFLREVKLLAAEQYVGGSGVAAAFLKALHQRRSIVSNSPRKAKAAVGLTNALKAADRALVFTETTAAAEAICNGLNRRDVFADTVHSALSQEIRRGNLRDFRTGRLDALVTARVLDEGVDLPAADLAIVVSGSQTRRQMVQRLGRVLRRKPDDRLARLAVLFLEDTVEDPRLGGHEVFLGEALGICDEWKVFGEGELENACEFLTLDRPEPVPGPPRRVGEMRGKSVRVERDDYVDVFAFLATTRSEAPALIQRPVARSSERPATARRSGLAGPRSRSGRASISRLRNTAYSEHPYATARQIAVLEQDWGRLVVQYGESAALAGVRRSLKVEVIEETARIVSEREVSAAQRVDGANQTLAPRAPTSRRRRRREPIRPVVESTRFWAPAKTQRVCPSCQGPELSCAC